MHLTLHQFEQIDGLMASLLRMGDFMTCADPREYIRTSNILGDKLIDALGYEFFGDFADALECAAFVVTGGLLGTIEVLDAEGV